LLSAAQQLYGDAPEAICITLEAGRSKLATGYLTAHGSACRSSFTKRKR